MKATSLSVAALLAIGSCAQRPAEQNIGGEVMVPRNDTHSDVNVGPPVTINGVGSGRGVIRGTGSGDVLPQEGEAPGTGSSVDTAGAEGGQAGPGTAAASPGPSGTGTGTTP